MCWNSLGACSGRYSLLKSADFCNEGRQCRKGGTNCDSEDFVSAIGFMDVDLLRPGCVATMNPVKSYGLRVASVYVALSLVVEELDAHSH
eukprot:4108309-Amphidinium_carterae.1